MVHGLGLRDEKRRAPVVEEQRHAEHDVLVEKVADDAHDALVVPAPVHQEQALQEAKLRDGVVARHRSLHALLPADAHADVRNLSRQPSQVSNVSQGCNL